MNELNLELDNGMTRDNNEQLHLYLQVVQRYLDCIYKYHGIAKFLNTNTMLRFFYYLIRKRKYGI